MGKGASRIGRGGTCVQGPVDGVWLLFLARIAATGKGGHAAHPLPVVGQVP